MKRPEFLLVLLCGLLCVPHLSGFQHSHRDELLDVDKRKAAAHRFEADKKASSERLKGMLPDAQVELDEITGAPRMISARDGFLSGKNGVGRGISTNSVAALARNEAHHITKAFLHEHKELFGHGPEALQEAVVKRNYATKHNGLKTTVWQQELEGVPIFEGLLVSHVTKNEELVSVSSRFISAPAVAADRGTKNRKTIQSKPPITAKRAISLAAANVEEEVAPEKIEDLGETDSEPRRKKFRSPNLSGETYAELAWLPISAEEMRLCWQVILTRQEHGDMFLLLVDVETGAVLIRRGLTRNISDATYNVFTGESPTPMSPGHTSPITDQPVEVARQMVTFGAFSTNASPLGWINDGVNETIGNNVEAQLDRDGNNTPDLPRPQGSPFRVFDAAQDLSQSPATYGDASVVQLFYWCNWMHDRLYELGFTEAAGNFQQNNLGQGGLSGDPVRADAQDNYSGSTRNNANFSTPPDGLPGRMQMLVYTRSGSEPDRDPALDAQIVLHEYTHGLSDRLVGGGMGMTKVQSRGMAEGWSDFYALALLSSPTNDVHASYPFGAYVARKLFPASFELNYYYGARRYPYSTDLTKHPLTFKDIDPNQAGSYSSVPRALMNSTIAGNADAVHNQGEIWCAALWEARANLITKYGFSIGNELILQLVTDGMKLCPPNPNFLQARDAILQADQINNSSANHPELWAAFAKRGMGFFATSPASSTTVGVVESFAVPDSMSILPDAGIISSGSTGGPFLPASQGYAVSNISQQTISWSVQNVATWLNVSSHGGTLAPGNSHNVTLSINQPVAGNLPSGLYTNSIVFMNDTTGIAQTRRFILRIGQPDAFTELFDLNDFDLSNQSFTFTPDDSSSFYSVCSAAVTNFYSDPTGGTSVVLGDDDFEKITLPANVAFYGTSAIELFIGSNGYLTLGSGDETHSESFGAHFALRRIAPLFVDLVPGANNVSWKVFTNRVAVTYLNVAEYGTSRKNSFQVELFYDSRIRITYLQVATRNGIVGLSRGTGIPAALVESDYSRYSECAPALQVFVPASADESNGIVSGQVTIHAPLTTNLTVSLFSGDNSQATVPIQIVLPAQATTAAFDINIVDDDQLDGTQPVTLTAAANGYQNGRGTIRIDDNEAAVLTVSLPGSVVEGTGTIQGSVFIQDFAAAADVKVELSSIDPFRLRVPASVTILAGQSSVDFEATVLDNDDIDGNSLSTITANVANWEEGSAEVTILDDEDRNLRLHLPSSAREGNGTLPMTGSVHISGLWPEDLVIGLTSDSPGEVSVPEYILIPAGSTFVTFNVGIGNDSTLDGSKQALVTAFAGEFASSQKTITVEDDETPLPVSNPRPAHLSSNNPVTVNLEWDPSLGEGTEQLINGGFESGIQTGWTSQTNQYNNFEAFSGSYTGSGVGTPVAPFAGHFSLIATQANAGIQTLIQQVTLPLSEVVTVSWVDLIRNVSTAFESNHQFRVELRNTNNAVLSVLFSTSTDFPAATDWTVRNFNLSQYRGTTLRLAFVIQAAMPGLNVFLDDLSIRSGNPPQTTYDVYFGTNAIPPLAGSTTNLFWDPPAMDPFNTYFWKIVSRRIGEVSSPVWEFATVPTLSVEDISLVEGHSGSSIATFTLALSEQSPGAVTVEFATMSGSAMAGEDFVAMNGNIEFLPGETNKSIEVSINGDTNFEEHETFSIRFNNTQNAAIERTEAVCTIIDDDSILAPIPNKTVNEGVLLSFTAQAGSPGVAFTETITDFESFDVNSGNGTVMFREPRFSSSTSTYLNSSPSISRITNSFPTGHDGSQVLAISCSFNSTANGWLRLTTSSASNLPNPTISFIQALQFDIYTDREMNLGLGVSETGTTNAIGSNGGTSSSNIEFIGVTNKVSSTPRPSRTIPAGSWQRVSFNIPAEPIIAMTGNGSLDLSTGKGVLEHLGIVPNAGTGVYNFFLDNFAVVYTNQLTFSLSNAPSGATINPYTGAFSWTPSESQGPGVYTIGVNVTDGAEVNETRSFTVTVNEANSTPLLSSILNKTITELTTLSFSAIASDTDIPSNSLTFSFDSAPAGASIHPVTGAFSWTPTEAQGPSTNTVIVRVTDNGSPNLSATRTFFVSVTEVNNAPVISSIADQFVYANSSLTLQVTASDSDLPPTTLTFSLTGTPPSGASIHSSSGLFTWPNITAPVGSTNMVTVRVQDNGSPTLTGSQAFAVIVVAAPLLQQVQLIGDELTVSWSAVSGYSYRVQYSTTLESPNWEDLGDVTAQGSSASLTEIISGDEQKFYRVLVLP